MSIIDRDRATRTHTCADYLPQHCWWITPENVVVDCISCWNVRVDVYFRDSVNDFGLALDHFDVFRYARGGISVQNRVRFDQSGLRRLMEHVNAGFRAWDIERIAYICVLD